MALPGIHDERGYFSVNDLSSLVSVWHDRAPTGRGSGSPKVDMALEYAQQACLTPAASSNSIDCIV